MFIRKWRYEQNLENARREGIREGRREANEQKFAYIEYLEEENKALKDKLADTCDTPCACENEVAPGQNAKDPDWVDPDS